MRGFFELEIGYVVIALFFLVITAIVTTRSFMPKDSFKKGMLIVGTVLVAFIAFHYHTTKKRMDTIAKEFNDGKIIVCEDREKFHGMQVMTISKAVGWKLKDGIFYNPKYYRKFHSARCTLALRQDIK